MDINNVRRTLKDGSIGENIPFIRIRRITGYLSDVNNFNEAKQAELKDRVKHDGSITRRKGEND